MSRFFKIFDRSFQKLKNPLPLFSNFRSIWCKPGCEFEGEEAELKVDCHCHPKFPKACGFLKCRCGGLVDILEKHITPPSTVRHDTVLLELNTIVYSYEWLFTEFPRRRRVKVCTDSEQAYRFLTLRNKKPKPHYWPRIVCFFLFEHGLGSGVKLSAVSRQDTLEADLVGRYGRSCVMGVLIAEKSLNMSSGDIVQYLDNINCDVFVCDRKYQVGEDFRVVVESGQETSVLVAFEKPIPSNVGSARSFPSLTLFDFLLKTIDIKANMKNVTSVHLFKVKKLLVIGEQGVVKFVSFDSPFSLLLLTKSCVDSEDKKSLAGPVLSADEVRGCLRAEVPADFYDREDRVLLFTGGALRETTTPKKVVGRCLFLIVLG